MPNEDQRQEEIKKTASSDCEDIQTKIALINVKSPKQEELQDTAIRMIGIVKDFIGEM